MDAEQVWKLWRRLLRDETLQQQLFQAQGATQWLQHFPEDERTILQAYAGQFDRVKWFVENYQFRLVNSFTNALETGAPLTLRALINIGLVYVATQMGWVVAEAGRQPWTIQDILPVGAAASAVSAGNVKTTFFMFAVLFTILLVAEVTIILKQIKKGPEK